MGRKKTGTALAVPNRQAATATLRTMGTHEVRVQATYRTKGVTPVADGPWTGEADKIAFVEPVDGYGCIILREQRTGALGGYVGVEPGHPLHGWEPFALAALGLKVHGGVTYAAACMSLEREDRSICHVGASRPRHVSVSSHRAEDDLWWIGFTCDHEYDLVPSPRRGSGAGAPGMDGVLDRAYRDEGYVYEQCVSLAAQLAAVADGRDPAEAVLAVPPPAGLVPPTVTRR